MLGQPCQTGLETASWPHSKVFSSETFSLKYDQVVLLFVFPFIIHLGAARILKQVDPKMSSRKHNSSRAKVVVTPGEHESSHVKEGMNLSTAQEACDNSQ